MTEEPAPPSLATPPSLAAPPRPRIHPLVSILVFLAAGFVVAPILVATPLAMVWIGANPELLHGRESLRADLERAMSGMTGLLLVVALYLPMLGVLVFCRRVLDRKSFLSLGLAWSRRSGRQLLAGLAAGAGTVLLVFGILVLTGDLRVNGWAVGAQGIPRVALVLLAYAALFLFQGGIEEIMCRGYLQQTLMVIWRPWLAVAAVSVFFGGLHFLNPGASWVGFLENSLIGAFFSIAYLGTRALWFPIGMHAAWNFTLGTVASLPVSGIHTFHLFEVEVVGSPLMTGGRYGLEGSVVNAGLSAACCVAGLVWLRLTPPGRQRPHA